MHSPWVGVDLGTDQVAWARLLRCAHDVMLSERGTPAVLRDLIVRSWARCIEARVDPEQPAQPVLDKDETLHRLDAHPLVTVVPVVHELFADVAQDARHLAVLADAQGLLLWAEGHPSMAKPLPSPTFCPAAGAANRGSGASHRHGTCPRSRGGDLLGRALQPPASRVDHFGRADSRPRHKRVAWRNRPIGLLPPRPPAHAFAGERGRAAGRGRARRASGQPRPRAPSLLPRPRGAVASGTQRAR